MVSEEKPSESYGIPTKYSKTVFSATLSEEMIHDDDEMDSATLLGSPVGSEAVL